MTPSEAEFWQAGVRRGRKDTPCPKLVWAYIHAANRRSEPWQASNDEWARKLMRVIARSPTIFPSQNPELKGTLKALDLDWLRPSQIARIRECPAPRRKVPRGRYDRWFGFGPDPRSLAQGPKCKQLFWAWRSDQKTCDAHWWAASMLRVEKHRKANKDRERNALQLKDARGQLKRVRRAHKRAKRLAPVRPDLPATPAKLKAQTERADLSLLQSIRLGFKEASIDPNSERFKTMIRGGYVVTDKPEAQTYKLSGKGLQLLGQLRRRVWRAREGLLKFEQ